MFPTMGVSPFLFLAIIINGLPYSILYQKEFIFNFMEGFSFGGTRPIPRIHIVNPTYNAARINITTPLLTWGPAAIDESDILPAKSFLVKEFHTDIMSSGSSVENKTIRIMADVDVAVYGFEVQKWGSDSFSVPSVNQLGKEFVAVTYGDQELAGGPFSIALSSACDGNMVNISLTGRKSISTTFTATAYTNGDIISIALDQYQSAQILFDVTDGGDFSGTYVTSDSPIFVQAGAVKTAIGTTSYQDYITESLPPVSTLGTLYYVVPFKRGSGGDVIRIIAVKDPTHILVTNQNGQAVHYDLLSPFFHVDINTMNSDDYFHIEASNKILVAQFLKSKQASSTNEADPAVAILNDVLSWTNNYHFSTMKYYSTMNMDSHYVNIAISRLAVDGLRLNGAVLGVNFTEIGSSGFAGAQLPITEGFHALTHEHGVPFSAIYYAYAHLSGAAVNLHIPSASPSQCPNPTVETTTEPETSADVEKTANPETATNEEQTTKPDKTTAVEQTTQPEPTIDVEQITQPEPIILLVDTKQHKQHKTIKPTEDAFTTKKSGNDTSHPSNMSTESVTKSAKTDSYVSANQPANGNSSGSQCKHCNLEVCLDPGWLPWQPWTLCSSACGKGTRQRNRDCRNPGFACSAGNKALEFCSGTHCDPPKELHDDDQEAIKQKFFSWPVLTEADRRPVSCTIGGGMIFFLVLVAALILLLDIGHLHRHCRKYNRLLNTGPKAKKIRPSLSKDSKKETLNLQDL